MYTNNGVCNIVSELDIVSRYQEPSDEEKLDELATNYVTKETYMKLYKHTIFGWKLVCNGNFDVIDKQIREFNYISQSKVIE